MDHTINVLLKNIPVVVIEETIQAVRTRCIGCAQLKVLKLLLKERKLMMTRFELMTTPSQQGSRGSLELLGDCSIYERGRRPGIGNHPVAVRVLQPERFKGASSSQTSIGLGVHKRPNRLQRAASRASSP
ncbi:uncharacterized protein LOC104414340 isoform X1 [Eucalyptus grandis]|uniref:uncharacterized protein LOC104414340 isoform X1 n=1 Tax=Eucalyptus grandis TaxID=71139 RepID=UPI00192E9574|nr:uncharacterized protein LOC104414340 isoform X1 [Eucalyptus grandis]